MGSKDVCTWHDEKAVLNVQKHGIYFEDVADLFDGRPMLVQRDLRRDYGEMRYNALCRLDELILNIAFTERSGKIHLISARIASRKEKASFYDQVQDR